jgi:hypothetical protein
MQLSFHADYAVGDMVYHKTDGAVGVVTGYLIRPGIVIYKVTWGGSDKCEGNHIVEELTTEKPL